MEEKKKTLTLGEGRLEMEQSTGTFKTASYVFTLFKMNLRREMSCMK